MNTTPKTHHVIPTGKLKTRGLDDQGREFEIILDWDAVWVLTREARGNKTRTRKSGPVTVKAVA